MVHPAVPDPGLTAVITQACRPAIADLRAQHSVSSSLDRTRPLCLERHIDIFTWLLVTGTPLDADGRVWVRSPQHVGLDSGGLLRDQLEVGVSVPPPAVLQGTRLSRSFTISRSRCMASSEGST